MKVTITYGPARVEVENGDVENVRQLIGIARDELNIPEFATPTVNGAEAGLDDPIADGDEVAFTKPTGQKG